MGIFSYKNFTAEESKNLLADALALSTYTYHNLDNGLAYGYQHHGYHTKLPLTLINAIFGNSHSQGIVPRLPSNPNSEMAALHKVNQAGWFSLSARELGYAGKTDARGTFYGETAGYGTAEAEIMGKYDSSGKLINIGIAFRGTSGPRENLLKDTAGDILIDIVTSVSSEHANTYAYKAFAKLLGNVADYAQSHGLRGDDIVVSGHSLGGLATNSMAALSDTKWNGFYSQSQYIAFASPTQYEQGNKVMNVGFENDPVFRALDGNKATRHTWGVHDTPHASTTDNIVNFNDYYASKLWNLLPFSIANLPAWISHMPFMYDDGLTRILNSEFYSLTERDSTVIVANLSETMRGKTWVKDLNNDALPHTGPTFIIGSSNNDLIQGGKGNDYLDGGFGNDIFRDAGGFNIVAGGKGFDLFDLQCQLSSMEIAYDGDALYIRNKNTDELTIAHDIEGIRSKEPRFLLLSKEIDYQITDYGLRSGSKTTGYARSANGSNGDDSVQAGKYGEWLFGLAGDDTLTGTKGKHTFVGGAGDDAIYAGGHDNSFLFEGDFGHDIIHGFQAGDKLIFMGVEGATGHDVRDFVHDNDGDLIFDFGHSSVTLAQTDLSMLEQAYVILS